MRNLHQRKRTVQTDPARIIREYVEQTKLTLGVCPGQVWSLTDLNRRISWTKHKNLQRFHFMLTEIFMKLDEGNTLEGMAMVIQSMKATHQCMLDDGQWNLAWHLICMRDPLAREKFGGSERELEAIAAYSRSIEELDQRMRRENNRARSGNAEDHDEKDGNAKPKGKGK